ncbi:CDP-diacylglycerol--serine O-phosphatidyltransferase [Candidatus Cardinium hertigii]|nr:CDP-diacylglycerol--serine O-phosphatidyltransferase [Candidatus Cardinium hertigii]
MQKYIPNCLSIVNLISGTIGMLFVAEDRLVAAAYAIFIGALFDFLDGATAKLLSAQSSMGKQLDSLADLITFGLLPAGIMYKLIRQYTGLLPLSHTALLIVICTALRLSKFNVDYRQTDQFIGLPTPANALLIATLPILLTQPTYPCLIALLTNPFVLPLLSMLLSFLLVSHTPFIAFKFKGLSFQSNSTRYYLLGIGLVFVLAMQIKGIFFAIWFYIFSSLYRHVRH